MSSFINLRLFGRDLQTKKHLKLEFEVVIMLIMEVMMIQIVIMEDS